MAEQDYQVQFLVHLYFMLAEVAVLEERWLELQAELETLGAAST